MEKIINWIGQTIPALKGYELYALIGAAVVVVLLIILIIALCAKGSKKKKAKAATASTPVVEEPKQEAAPEEPKEEDVPSEEPKEEPVEEVTPEEEPVVEEPAPTEEVKEEEKVEPAEEEPVEEAKVEPAEEVAPVVEEKPAEEPAKKEAKPKKDAPAKKAPAKKAPAKEVPVKNEPKAEPAPVEEPVKEEPKAEKKGAQGKYILVQEGPNWVYKLKASNGEVIIVSEPYKTEKAVRTGIETLKKNLELSSVDIIEDKHGLFSFRIMTKQGRCLATSANYKAKARAISASESYKRWATTDIVLIDEDAKNSTTEVEKFEVEVEEENTGKFVIKSEGDGFVYQLVAANGRVIATSLIYRSKDSCVESCDNFRECVYKGDFYISKDKNAKFQFKLYNKQNRLVLAGEVYDDKARVISVIEAIKRLAKLASVEDLVAE